MKTDFFHEKSNFLLKKLQPNTLLIGRGFFLVRVETYIKSFLHMWKRSLE